MSFLVLRAIKAIHFIIRLSFLFLQINAGITMATNINQINRNDLKFVKKIREGGFSSVYQMTWMSPSLGPIEVAVKKLIRHDEHDLEVMSKLDHPNIVKLIGVVDEKMDFMLILELCEGGRLSTYLNESKGKRLSERQFYDWAEQAARPLEYLRQNKLFHKDVKSLYYMITSENTLKLWMTPELLDKGILSPKDDIFALAVVLWELWTGKFTSEDLESKVVAWNVCHENVRLPIPEDCPESIKDLMRQSWDADWHQRPDIHQVILVVSYPLFSIESRFWVLKNS